MRETPKMRRMKRKNKFFHDEFREFWSFINSVYNRMCFIGINSAPFNSSKIVKPFVQAENFTGVCRIDLSQSDYGLHM
jgi:hypothetical protein